MGFFTSMRVALLGRAHFYLAPRALGGLCALVAPNAVDN